MTDREKIEVFVRNFLSLSSEDQTRILAIMEEMLRIQRSNELSPAGG